MERKSSKKRFISEEDKNKLSVRYEVNKTMAAKEFYEADSKGQQWLAGSDRMLQRMAGRSLEEKLEALAAKPGNGYDEQTGLIFTEIPMERGESLHIDLELKEGDKRYEIRSWYVYDSGEYEIDDTVKVWDGKDHSGT